MPRQRYIWPDFWDDTTIGRLTHTQRLFFIGCFSNADDDGRLIGDPAYLRGALFKYDDPAPTLDQVRQMRDAVAAACKHFMVYEVDGGTYIALLKWSEWQHPKYPKPSRLPPPPAENPPKQAEKYSSNASETLGQASSVGWVGLGRDELGRDGEEERAREETESTPVAEIVAGWKQGTEESGKNQAAGCMVQDLLLEKADEGWSLDLLRELARESATRDIPRNWLLKSVLPNLNHANVRTLAEYQAHRAKLRGGKHDGRAAGGRSPTERRSTSYNDLVEGPEDTT
jgi:hypothetical protein